MTTAATISAKLILDSSDFDAGLGSANKKAKGFQEKMRNVGSALMGVGAKATAGLTVPIVTAAVGMVKAAADYEEASGAVETVFGNMSGAVDDFSEISAETVGLSAADFKQLSAVGGASLQNMGFDAGEAAEEMVVLTKRAADLGATFNKDTTQALNAVQSALKGEFEPMKEFGVAMNAAMIKARALEMGLADQNGEVDRAAKAQAALAIFYEQTAKIQGAFERESDGVTGLLKIIRAQIADLSKAFGKQLLPYVITFLGHIEDLVEKFQALSPEQKGMILKVLGLVAVLGPAIMIIGGFVTAISAIMPVVAFVAGILSGPIVLAIAAVIAIFFALKYAWDNNLGGIRDKFDNFVAWLKPKWDKLWGGIKEYFEQVWENIQDVWEIFQAAFDGDWYEFGEKLREAWDQIWDKIKEVASNAWNWFTEELPKLIEKIVDFFKNTDWGEVGKNIVRGIGDGLASMAGWIWTKAQDLASNIKDAVDGFFGNKSPSTLMSKSSGPDIAQGLIKGFEETISTFSPEMALAKADTSVPQAKTPDASGNNMVVELLKVIAQKEMSVNLEGNMGAFVRESKPFRDKEDARIGSSLISGGVVR